MDTTLTELRAHPKSIEIQQYLSDNLSAKRLQHVLSVQEMAVDLAYVHKADAWQASLAALLHDSAKWMNTKELYNAVRCYENSVGPD